jgi:hypothetical protein
MIANAAIRDPRLSWKAKGILAGALSHGPGFRFNREWFMRNSTDGDSAVRTGMEELRQLGYLATERVIGPNGQFLPGGLHFSDDPSLIQQPEPSGGEPDGGKTCGGKSTSGESDHIRRSIERTPREEHQVEVEPPLPPAGGTHAQDDHFRGVTEMVAPPPALSGTVVADPQPQHPAAQDHKAPSPTKARMKAFVPTAEDIPACLLPVEAPLRAFWQDKAGQRTQQAWNCLTGALERIWQHPDGGTAAVREQLENATQAGWRSITFANWQKYGQTALAPAGFSGGRRKSSTEAAADAVIAFYNSMETA